jgi:hypothetical protein
MLNVLLSAKLSGAPVFIQGTDGCTTETLPGGINTIEIAKTVRVDI